MELNEKILVDTFDHGYKRILNSIVAVGINKNLAKEILDKRLTIPKRVKTINALLERLLISAQNASGKPNIIGRPILGVPNLKDILCDFSPKEILDTYGYRDPSSKGMVAVQVLHAIDRKFPKIGLSKSYKRSRKVEILKEIFEKRETQLNAFNDPLNTWNKFAFTIIDSAIFLSKYDRAENFYSEADESMKIYIHNFAENIQEKISGIGYALACDFLKEVGVDCGKPDVHIKAILEGVISPNVELSDQDLQEAMNKISKKKKTTLFAVDKVFWMIGTTNFSIQICNYRESFINECIEDLK